MNVKLEGRLGNQLFQYAFWYYLRKEYSALDVKLDSFFLRRKRDYLLEQAFSVHPDMCTKKEHESIGNIIKESEYDESILSSDACLDGFWQSEDFFKKYSCEILDTLVFREVNDQKNKRIESCIRAHYSVSLHIRRTDYLWQQYSGYYLDLSRTRYYDNSIELIRSMRPDAVFFVFSDDIEWCRDRLDNSKFIFVECNKKTAWKDMYLMSLCDCNIVANSSFSWWGAYLGKNENVLVPKDEESGFALTHPKYYPERWVRIEL